MVHVNHSVLNAWLAFLFICEYFSFQLVSFYLFHFFLFFFSAILKEANTVKFFVSMYTKETSTNKPELLPVSKKISFAKNFMKLLDNRFLLFNKYKESNLRGICYAFDSLLEDIPQMCLQIGRQPFEP